MGEPEDDQASGNLVDNIDESMFGRVIVDLEGIVDGDLSSNATVGSGDRIFVPRFSNTIAVVGEVYEPGTFRFQDGISLKQYVETAGGKTKYALGRNIYLLKANGSVVSPSSGLLRGLGRFNESREGSIEPGDVIVVPANLSYDSPLQRVTAITQVVFQSFTSIAAFLNIAKQ